MISYFKKTGGEGILHSLFTNAGDGYATRALSVLGLLDFFHPPFLFTKDHLPSPAADNKKTNQPDGFLDIITAINKARKKDGQGDLGAEAFLMVDDASKNLEGAAAAGMKTVWITEQDAFAQKKGASTGTPHAEYPTISAFLKEFTKTFGNKTSGSCTIL